MKHINKYLALALATVAVSSCDDLDTEYLGGYVTTDQKEAVLEANPTMAQASVNAIFSDFSRYMSVLGDGYHNDIGYPAVMIGLDMQGQDYVSISTGYNWYATWMLYSSPSPSAYRTVAAWGYLYDQIYASNAITESIPADATASESKFFRANALATRAFDYFVLAQLYQFTYVGHESMPCVPIITEENAEDAAVNGCPRATVQEVYDRINADLDEAIELLKSSSYTREQALSTKPKRMIDLSTAYGIRARVDLVMQRWAKAAEDAQNAISNFSGAPLSQAEASVPGFNDITANNWMWGIAIAETDRVVTSGIVNFPSHTCTFAYGYVTVGAWKWCDARLYAQIPAKDVRKGWFLDENLTSPDITAAQQEYINGYSSSIQPYTNVKFDSYQSVLGQSTNASDIPLMRIEEMYYILAEGQAMSGQVDAGRQTLVNFVTTYRNPAYSCSATTAAEVQDAVYQERRVELWGEGLTWFDTMRLDKPVDRRNSNWPATAVYYIPSEKEDADLSVVRIYCLPQSEINGNPKISQSDNNKSGEKPSAL
jgi:hypothetical protein